VRIGGPFRRSRLLWSSLYDGRTDGGVHPVWQAGPEFQFTYRPYKSLLESTPATRGPRSVPYQRQIFWLGIGYAGLRTSPSFVRTIAPSSGWLRVGAGRGVPIYNEDDLFVGANDPLFAVELQAQKQITNWLAIEGRLGVLIDEDIFHYEGDLRGQPMKVIDSGPLHMRPMWGLQVTVTR
jgi:hypothetical protein